MFQDTEKLDSNQDIIKNIEKVAEHLICASLADVCCEDCQSSPDREEALTDCPHCHEIIERVKKFNCGHSCGFSCHKKKKQLTIKSNEGHGHLDKKLT